MATAHKTPMIRDLTDAGLVEHYVGLKALIHSGAAMRSPRLGAMLKQLDITVAVARKRGVRLPV